MRVVDRGLELVDKASRAVPPTDFADRIAPNPAVATEEALQADSLRLKALKDQ